jgi:hypothetical protein
MLIYKADGAIVISRFVIMLMEYHYECRYQKNQYEKCGKAFMPNHIVHVEHKNRLIFANDFVKKLLKKLRV